jgi:hypothetical protein
MATGQTRSPTHQCSCGETFETTEDLVAHAREEHGLWIH